MMQALALADRAAHTGEVPVGALVVLNGTVIGEGWNQCITTADPTAHAEVIALRQAALFIGNYRLTGATIYVTLEPCSMCAGAMIHARVSELVFGATEPKTGVVCSQGQFFSQPYLNHRVSVVGDILAEQSTQRLQAFFKARRMTKKQMAAFSQIDY